MLPFNTRAKYEDTNAYKFKKNKNIAEIKAKVSQLKKERAKRKDEEEAVKNRKYLQGQTAMKKMHESMMRDKGIVMGPGHQNIAIMPGSVGNFSSKAPAGYKVPRKFTLESLSNMHYGDFTIPNVNNEYGDEFKPEDILDSDDEIDEEIEHMYQFKDKRSMNDLNSIMNLNSNIHSSAILPGTNKRFPNGSINNSIAYHPQHLKHPHTNKNSYTSVPITNAKKRNKNLHVNKSMISHNNNNRNYKPTGRNPKQHSTTRARGHSVHHSAIALNKRHPKSKHVNSNYPSKQYRNKSSKNTYVYHSDHSPGRNKIKDRFKIGNQALKRTKEYDLKARKLKNQKLSNVLKMHNYE